VANTKITELTQLTNPVSTDVLPIVDVGADVTKKISIADLLKNAAAGAVDAAGIAFDGDGNTGLYKPESDQLAVTTGGSQALLIDGSGNITASGTSTAGSFIPTSSTVPTNGVYLPGANSVALATNSAGRLFIDASGNVGVGAVSAVRFSVTQNQSAYSYFDFTNTTAGGGIVWRQIVRNIADTGTTSIDFVKYLAGGFGIVNNDTDAANFTAFKVGASERVRITSSGRLGVGTSNPTASLAFDNSIDTNGFDVSKIRFFDDLSGSIVGFGTSSGQLNYRGAGAHVWYDGTNERMRIASNGKVGINNASPSQALDVVGSSSVSASSFAQYFAINAVGTGDAVANGLFAPAGNTLGFSTGASERLRIDSAGNLLAGTSLSRTVGGFTPRIQLEGITDNGSTLSIVRNQDSFAFPQLVFGKSRANSNGGVTAVQSGDYLGVIRFCGADGTDMDTNGAFITCEVDGTPGANDMPGRLVFSTTADGASNPTERMRISSAGIITHNSNQSNDWAFTTKHDGDNNDRFGLSIWCGKDDATGTNYAVEIADGDGTNQGFITFTGGTVTYGAFTAHHPCILPDEDNESGYSYGTLLETVSIEYKQKDGVATERGIQYVVRKTQAFNSKTILGAYGSSMNNGPTGATNLHQALVLGDGHILCNGIGGNIKAGDGICSSNVAGIGQKATATPSMIIGIAQEDVTFDGDETKLVPVQYGLQQFTPWGE
jgi:hypothetical protein